MKQKLKKEIKALLSQFKAIRYVHINKKDAFYVFKELELDVEEYFEEYNYNPNGNGNIYGSVYYPCAILHNDNLIKKHNGLQNYITKYRGEIDASPEFTISNILEDKKFKIHSPKYITPIRNLFREIGLLLEKRGKFKKIDKNKKQRDRLIITLYKEIVKKTKRKKPFPIRIIYDKLPPDIEVSFSTIRRVLNKAGY
jgi:hypothetical protein